MVRWSMARHFRQRESRNWRSLAMSRLRRWARRWDVRPVVEPSIMGNPSSRHAELALGSASTIPLRPVAPEQRVLTAKCGHPYGGVICLNFWAQPENMCYLSRALQRHARGAAFAYRVIIKKILTTPLAGITQLRGFFLVVLREYVYSGTRENRRLHGQHCSFGGVTTTS
jgi:hypothetical protein